MGQSQHHAGADSVTMPSIPVHGSDSECHVVSGHFAMLVQAFLGFAVLATLWYKRWRESPKRTCTVWAMDTSKQCFSGGMQHFVNIVLAVVFARGHTMAGECIWYITNFSITVFFGLFILTGYMRLHRMAVEKYGLTILRSGEYGDPPRIEVWFVQMLLWCFVACAEKFITAFFVILPLHGFIDRTIASLEVPFKPYPKTELVLVMVVGPTLLNMVFAWVVDNLIKDRDLQHGMVEDESDASEEESDESEDVEKNPDILKPLVA